MAVMNVTYMSYHLRRYVNLKVILPVEDTKDYNPNPIRPEKYKTLYLLHGFSGNESDWLNSSRIFKLARDRKIAVVMPSAENSFYIDDEERDIHYASYIGKEIVDVTRKMFPLSDKKEDTHIAGLSMGGFGSLLIGSRFAETFGSIISLSSGFLLNVIKDEEYLTSLNIGNPKFYSNIFGDLDTIHHSDKDPLETCNRAHKKGILPSIYLACGRQDVLFDLSVQMKNDLMQQGIEVTWVEDDGDHDWVFWDKYIEKAIDWSLSL